MPWYRCLLQGKNFMDADQNRIGFVTTRHVEAEDAGKAKELVLQNLWHEEKFKLLSRSHAAPLEAVAMMEVEELLQPPQALGAGYTFYAIAEESGA